MAEKLRVFVASSSEQLAVAAEIAQSINRSKAFYAQPWDKDVFEFSKAYIESLERELDRADFAVAVLTADDAGNVRGRKVSLPRDNVIFELGLFAGRLGRNRCFFFVDADSATKLASDLSGVEPVTFRRGAGPGGVDLKTRIGQVTEQMKQAGPRSKPSPAVREARESLWRFSTRFSGHWWERIRSGEDDRSALSYLTVSIDELTNTPKLSGKVFGLAGERLADWSTVTSGVLLSEGPPQVHYRWEGEHQDAHGQTYGGHGVILLEDPELTRGEGWFFDTNFARVSQDAVTRVKHFRVYRCPPEDVDTMRDVTADAARALIAERLRTLRG